jgi:regulator of protease activity HflC (stomatin/prohibitin superfamily)
MARRTLLEHERAVRYDRGRLVGVVGPGRIRYRRPHTALIVVDLRPQLLTVPAQEVLTSDGVPIRVSVVARWRVLDPVAYVNEARQTPEALYLVIQLALRAAVGGMDVEGVLSGRDAIDAALADPVAVTAGSIGAEVESVAVRDVMLTGETKRLFAQIVTARQEGLAALERARGETAALRSLANIASVLESHPALMQLRTLQATADAGATVVITNGVITNGG